MLIRTSAFRGSGTMHTHTHNCNETANILIYNAKRPKIQMKPQFSSILMCEFEQIFAEKWMQTNSMHMHIVHNDSMVNFSTREMYSFKEFDESIAGGQLLTIFEHLCLKSPKVRKFLSTNPWHVLNVENPFSILFKTTTAHVSVEERIANCTLPCNYV